jgi:hypothetical protein
MLTTAPTAGTARMTHRAQHTHRNTGERRSEAAVAALIPLAGYVEPSLAGEQVMQSLCAAPAADQASIPYSSRRSLSSTVVSHGWRRHPSEVRGRGRCSASALSFPLSSRRWAGRTCWSRGLVAGSAPPSPRERFSFPPAAMTCVVECCFLSARATLGRSWPPFPVTPG